MSLKLFKINKTIECVFGTTNLKTFLFRTRQTQEIVENFPLRWKSCLKTRWKVLFWKSVKKWRVVGESSRNKKAFHSMFLERNQSWIYEVETKSDQLEIWFIYVWRWRFLWKALKLPMDSLLERYILIFTSQTQLAAEILLVIFHWKMFSVRKTCYRRCRTRYTFVILYSQYNVSKFCCQFCSLMNTTYIFLPSCCFVIRCFHE